MVTNLHFCLHLTNINTSIVFRWILSCHMLPSTDICMDSETVGDLYN